MFGCQQVLIKPDKELRAILEYLCSESNKLHNCAVYYARQMYFKARKYVRAFDLNNELKSNPHYSSLCAQAAQQTCGAVGESIKSFKELIKLFVSGKLEDKPKFPNYRTSGGMHLIAYPRQALRHKLVDGNISIPLGRKVKAWFGLRSFTIPMPSNLNYADIRELRILPRNGVFYAEFVYKAEVFKADYSASNVLGIDHGIDNWLTCVSNVGTSFIVDGRHLKSLNQWYNKRTSVLMDGKPNSFWSHQLAQTTEKRNRQMRDAINKAARIVVNHCIEKGIGQIIFGWNKGQKKDANMGGLTNQKFVQIPTARLKERISQLCQQYGIQFIETEESYTSVCSFLDNDFLPTYGGEKPANWKPSGKRGVKKKGVLVLNNLGRGGYQTRSGIRVNSDCNGAANILRKQVATMPGVDLSGVGRGVLSAPLRIALW